MKWNGRDARASFMNHDAPPPPPCEITAKQIGRRRGAGAGTGAGGHLQLNREVPRGRQIVRPNQFLSPGRGRRLACPWLLTLILRKLDKNKNGDIG